jgi:hypothetical protein
MRKSVTSLGCVCLALSLGGFLTGRTVRADGGDQIAKFLKDLKDEHLAVELHQLISRRDPAKLGAIPPSWGESEVAPFADGCCGDDARTELAQALQVRPDFPPSAFQPDYCVFQVNDLGQSRALWIDSVPHQLQMRYYASDGTVDQCGIKEGPADGDVRRKLEAILANAASESISKMIRTIRKSQALKLMSIDPKPGDDVFAQKRWNVVGQVSIDTADDRKLIQYALDDAIFPAPIHTAKAFTPRLAVSAVIQTTTNGPWQQYVLLMSFECRRMALYVDGKFKGCCALNNGWPVNPRKRQLALELSSDQILYNMLVKAKQPIKPRSTSPSN